MARAITRVLVLAGTAVTAPCVLAQSVQVPPGATRVEPGIGDLGALSGLSRQDMRQDLRQQRGFGDVFRIDYARPFAGPGQTQSMFFRIDGGVAAVFPQGTYQETSGGTFPEVPPGTVFYVGGLPPHMTGSPGRIVPHSANYVDLSVSMSANRPPDMPTVIPAAKAPLIGTGGIWAGERERQQTVSSLLDRAAMGR